MRAVIAALALFASACAGAPTAPAGLHYVKVALSPTAIEQVLLTGPPQTAGMVAVAVVVGTVRADCPGADWAV